jgi:TRAP-type C4-dicarboxylate transport system permease small subunit
MALKALVLKAYDAILYGMAFVAGFLMVAMMAVIFTDVVLRNLGYQSSSHFFTFTEYALLVVPCLGAPVLVREKAHIYIEILVMALKPDARAALTLVIGVICVAVCAVLAWYGFDVTLRDFMQNEKDVRSLDMPRWMVVGFIPLSFAMMALEFLRFMVRRESFLGAIGGHVEP